MNSFKNCFDMRKTEIGLLAKNKEGGGEYIKLKDVYNMFIKELDEDLKKARKNTTYRYKNYFSEFKY